MLESDAVLRREAVTGLCLEALLGERLRHPNVVATLAWAVVTGKVGQSGGLSTAGSRSGAAFCWHGGGGNRAFFLFCLRAGRQAGRQVVQASCWGVSVLSAAAGAPPLPRAC